MITTILFDLSEVLISGLVGFEKKFAEMVGVPASVTNATEFPASSSPISRGP